MNWNAILAIIVIVGLGVLGYATFNTSDRIPPQGATTSAPTSTAEPARPVDPVTPGNSAVR